MADISPRQAAERLGKNEVTIRRWADRGAFPGARKMGHNWLIPEEDVSRIEREGLDLATLEKAEASV